MHIPVEVKEEFSEGSCPQCNGISARGLRTIYIFAGTGLETLGPLCISCWEKQSPDGGIKVQVQQPDLTPGRSAPSKKIRKRSLKQEREIAELVGGRTQPGSGNQTHAKGDVRKKGKYRIEAKLTTSEQYTLKRSILDKISSECSYGESPVLVIEFIDGVTHRKKASYVVLPIEDWEKKE